MRKITTTGILAIVILLIFSLNVFATENITLVPYNVSQESIESEKIYEELYKLRTQLLENLPGIQKYFKNDFYQEMSKAEEYKMQYPESYGGIYREDGKTVVNLKKNALSFSAAANQVAELSKSQKIGISVHEVEFSMNDLNKMMAKAEYYINEVGNDCDIILAARDEDSNRVQIGIRNINEEKISMAKKLLGDSNMLEFVDADTDYEAGEDIDNPDETSSDLEITPRFSFTHVPLGDAVYMFVGGTKSKSRFSAGYYYDSPTYGGGFLTTGHSSGGSIDRTVYQNSTNGGLGYGKKL